MRVGILTGGGDCPGLNAVIRAIVRKGEWHYGDELLGFADGWRGVMENDYQTLSVEGMRGTLPRGGTVLGTSRVHPFMTETGVAEVAATFEAEQLDALVVIGGEGTLSCAREMHARGFPIIGVPKTIDNDIALTERTFGFDTAVHVATAAIDRLHTTAESHDRVMVVEVMGRHVGHIAVWAGIAGGASITLVPEHPFDIDEVCGALQRRHQRGKYSSIVVVAEGARPKEGTLPMPEVTYDRYGHIELGGIGNMVAGEIAQRTGFETRVTVLGHVQRGGTPTAHDRLLSTWYGIAAIDAVHDEAWGQMVALQANSMVRVSLADATFELKTVSPELYSVASEFFA